MSNFRYCRQAGQAQQNSQAEKDDSVESNPNGVHYVNLVRDEDPTSAEKQKFVCCVVDWKGYGYCAVVVTRVAYHVSRITRPPYLRDFGSESPQIRFLGSSVIRHILNPSRGIIEMNSGNSGVPMETCSVFRT
jgi:hypothetical protein